MRSCYAVKRKEGNTHGTGMASDHECALCIRSFPSGAALGGHLSQHNLLKTFESKSELKAGMLNFGKKKNRCGVCESQFCSANLLLLHMGSHNEGDVREEQEHSSTQEKHLPSYSCLVPSTRTALDYLRKVFGCSSSSAGRVEETVIPVKVKPMEELHGRGQEGFACSSFGKRKRSEEDNHNSLQKTGAIGMIVETIEEPKQRSLGRVLFVPHLDLNELPPAEQVCLND